MIGHPLPWDVFTESGVLVACAGSLVADAKHFQKLTVRPLFRTAEAGAPSEDPKLVNVLERLEALAQEAESLLSPPYSAYLDVQIKELARELITLHRSDGDACLGYIRLAAVARPSLRHCLHVLLVSQLLANHLDLPEEQRLSLAAAALTMNLADLELHDLLHTQAAPLTRMQRGALTAHPGRAVALLREAGVQDAAWLAAVGQHHENMDGSGYPGGMTGAELSLPSRILRVADFYCAKIAARYYRPPKSSRLAMQELFGRDKHRLDNQIAVLLLRRMGLFPPGTLVRLANRESACIARQGRRGEVTAAMSFLDARGRLLAPPVERDITVQAYAMRGHLEEDRSWPTINWKPIWGY